MKTNNTLRAAVAVAVLGLATSAVAQVSADKIGKSTSGNTPAATPVTPGAPGKPLAGTSASDGYTTYWSTMDANNDGKVTRDEYNAYYSSRWDKYDTAKRGYYDKESLRSLYAEREMSKTDGHPAGSPLNPATKK
jgi:hypothetical protein